MDPCSQCVLNEDDVDNWFYDSVTRYKTLQMYDLEMVPQCMARLTDNWLCLSGHQTNRSEILCTELPRKLLVSEEESGRCKSNDFEITSGEFFDGFIRDIVSVGNGEVAIAGFKDERKLRKLQLGSDEGKITAAGDIFLRVSDMTEPNFAANPASNNIVVCKATSQPLIQLDISCNEEISHQLPEGLISMEGDLSPLYTDSGTVAVLNRRDGMVAVLDLRCENEAMVVPSQTSSHSPFTHASCEDNIATLSSAGLFSLFDFRLMGKVVLSDEIGDFEDKSKVLTMRFSNSRKFSVSGFDNSVQIFELASEVRRVFNHRGHSFVDGPNCNCKAVVTDHLWLPKISENCLVSCSSNGSLNCWRYNS